MPTRRMMMMATTALALGVGAAWADPVTLRIVSKDLLNSNPVDVAHIARIEKALAAQGTDVDIQIVEVASSGYADKLSAMLLSGDIPDIIYFQGGDAKIAEQGVLEDLTPWIEKSKWLKDALWPHNKDRLANYPYLLYVYPVRNPQPVIRQDWFDKTGLADPATIDDMVALYTKLKDGDYDGDGKADTYGVTTADNTNELDAFYNRAFGVSATWLKDKAGNWIDSRVSDQEKAKITFYAMLRQKGLYDPEYITTKWDTKEDKFYTGRAGTISGSSAEVIDIYGGKMRQVHPGVELKLLNPVEGPGGKGLAAVDVSKESRGFAISALSPHKAEAFAVLDFMASPEGQMMDRMGFEGEEYTKDGDSYKVTDKMATWYARFMVAANWTPPVQWMSDAAQQSLENVKKYYVADNSFVWPGEFAAKRDATENVYRSWVYKFISGEAPMDQWDAYVAEYMAAGGKDMTDYAKTVLDAK